MNSLIIMAKPEKLKEMQILCWNREGPRKNKQSAKHNKSKFWEAVTPPVDIAFLQEEIKMIGTQGRGQREEEDYSLFYDIKDYQEHFTKEKSINEATPIELKISKYVTPAKHKTASQPEAATPDDKGTPQDKMPVKETPKKTSKVYNAVAHIKQLLYTEDTKSSITNFVYDVLNTNTSVTLSETISQSDGKFMTYDEMQSVINTLFKQFAGHHISINKFCTENKFPNGEESKKKFKLNGKYNVTIEQIIEVHDRVCIVPLVISDQLILAVSLHGRHVGINKESHVKNILTVLDGIGQSTNCTAIVIGGDFNLDVKTKIQGFLDHNKFEVPQYNPTIHRVIHAASLKIKTKLLPTCIDYFVYKNYRDDYTVKVTEVKQKMLIGCPNLVIQEEPGQYNINLDDESLQEVKAISDHDPLFAKLTLYKSSATAQGTNTPPDTDLPQDTTDLPQDTTDSSQDTDLSQDSTDSSQDITDPPQDITDSPQDITDSPQDITDSPQDTTDLPNSSQDTTNSSWVTDSPQDTESNHYIYSSDDELIKQIDNIKIEDVNNDKQNSEQQTYDEDKVKKQLKYEN